MLQTRYCQSDQIEEDEMGGARGTHGEKTNAYRLLMREPEGKRKLARLILKWILKSRIAGCEMDISSSG